LPGLWLGVDPDRQLDAAEVYLRQAEAAVGTDDALLGTILVAQAYNLRARGITSRRFERAQRALSLLPQEDYLSRSLVALTLGLAYWNLGSFREAEQAFMQSTRLPNSRTTIIARLTALTYLG